MENSLDNLNQEFVRLFDNVFSFLQKKKIVLYGLGYRTGAVINKLSDKYNFIGLMDRDKENIGKVFWDKSVLDENDVINQADCIIIISVSFYDVIYARIRHLDIDYHIPVYFPNGKRAILDKVDIFSFDRDYSSLNVELVKKMIDTHDIISFDLFDTLIMRRVYSPDTVFLLLEQKLKKIGIDVPFYKWRKMALVNIINRMVPSIDDIYVEFQHISKLPNNVVEIIKNSEIKLEKSIIISRNDVVELYDYALNKHKKVYIVTDMYLSKDILTEFLKSLKIRTDYNSMYVSCEYQATKESGQLWKIIRHDLGGDNKFKVLHIGDNQLADIETAKKQGIFTLQIYSSNKILEHTIFRKFRRIELSLLNQVLFGLITAKLFNSPFLSEILDESGCCHIQDPSLLGYIGYGTLIFEFIIWLWKYSNENNIEKLLFCARDGFLLKEDFDLWMNIYLDKRVESKYLKISRQLIRSVSISDQNQIDECLLLPFRGTCKQFFDLRFHLNISNDQNIELPDDKDKVEDIIIGKEKEIIEKSTYLRRNYHNYLTSEIGTFDKSAIVDFGYSGSSQFYLSRLLDKSLYGLYLLADLSTTNLYNYNQNKASYIYDEHDPSGNSSVMSKLFLLLESVFTAPYGTYISCDCNGGFSTADECTNQKYFKEKVKINNGIKEIIIDVSKIMDGISFEKIDIEDQMGQALLNMVFSGVGIKIASTLLKTFYSDDIFKIKTDRTIFDV